jgi:hypothetical protein
MKSRDNSINQIVIIKGDVVLSPIGWLVEGSLLELKGKEKYNKCSLSINGGGVSCRL